MPAIGGGNTRATPSRIGKLERQLHPAPGRDGDQVHDDRRQDEEQDRRARRSRPARARSPSPRYPMTTDDHEPVQRGGRAALRRAGPPRAGLEGWARRRPSGLRGVRAPASTRVTAPRIAITMNHPMPRCTKMSPILIAWLDRASDRDHVAERQQRRVVLAARKCFCPSPFVGELVEGVRLARGHEGLPRDRHPLIGGDDGGVQERARAARTRNPGPAGSPPRRRAATTNEPRSRTTSSAPPPVTNCMATPARASHHHRVLIVGNLAQAPTREESRREGDEHGQQDQAHGLPSWSSAPLPRAASGRRGTRLRAGPGGPPKGPTASCRNLVSGTCQDTSREESR